MRRIFDVLQFCCHLDSDNSVTSKIYLHVDTSIMNQKNPYNASSKVNKHLCHLRVSEKKHHAY